MIYACDSCKFVFEHVGEVDRCPDCGKKTIREAGNEEKQEYIEYQKEKNKHLFLCIEPYLLAFLYGVGQINSKLQKRS